MSFSGIAQNDNQLGKYSQNYCQIPGCIEDMYVVVFWQYDRTRVTG